MKKMKFALTPLLLAVLLLMNPLLPNAEGADMDGQDTHKFQAGLRGGVFAASGEPSNDMMTYGIYGRYRINESLLVGLSVDSITFDFEQPAKILKIVQDKLVAGDIDADASSTVISIWAEREFGSKSGKLRPFVLGGIGFASVDADDLKGAVQGGGQFDITTDAGSEIIPSVGLGLRYLIADNWSLEAGARADYHMADWEVKNRTSGKKDSIGDYLALGAYAGVNFSF